MQCDSFKIERELCHQLHRNKHRESSKIRKQRNMFQIKKQDKTSEKGLNDTGISNVPEKNSK